MLRPESQPLSFIPVSFGHWGYWSCTEDIGYVNNIANESQCCSKLLNLGSGSPDIVHGMKGFANITMVFYFQWIKLFWSRSTEPLDKVSPTFVKLIATTWVLINSKGYYFDTYLWNKHFLFGVRIFCDWHHKWSSFRVILAHVAQPGAQLLGQSVSLKLSLESRLESESFEPFIDFLAFLIQKLWSKINKLINYLSS